jgi:hypothetical protein
VSTSRPEKQCDFWIFLVRFDAGRSPPSPEAGVKVFIGSAGLAD